MNLTHISGDLRSKVILKWASGNEAANTIAADVGLTTAEVIAIVNEPRHQFARVQRFSNNIESIFEIDGKNSGLKFDDGKTQFHLLPTLAIEKVNRVLMHGAEKYGENNWRAVDNADERYWNAAMRHMFAWISGEKIDSDTGISHLAHAACSLMFLLELEYEKVELLEAETAANET